MSAPHYARLVSRFVRDEASAEDGRQPSAEARQKAIDAVARAILARRKRALAIRASGVAAAACVVLGLGAWHRASLHHGPAPLAEAPNGAAFVAHVAGGAAQVVGPGDPEPLTQGGPIPRGSRLVTPAKGRSSLVFSTGTTVDVAEATDLTLGGDDASQVLRLGAGSVDLHVAKVGPGRRFLVDTVDSEVEVRGTRFSVAVVRSDPACGGGVRTRVAVTEGVVSVRSGQTEATLRAGDTWPTGCPNVAVKAASAGPSFDAVGTPRHVPSVGSTLAEENDLFAEALAAKRQGDLRSALTGFERLLARYPSSVLAESASVERIRVLRTTAPLRAVPAARQYLLRYSGGFARDEAQAIVDGAP